MLTEVFKCSSMKSAVFECKLMLFASLRQISSLGVRARRLSGPGGRCYEVANRAPGVSKGGLLYPPRGKLKRLRVQFFAKQKKLVNLLQN